MKVWNKVANLAGAEIDTKSVCDDSCTACPLDGTCLTDCEID